MANIKFSAFTQKAVTGNVDFLVGYTGADNVRISPAIFSDTYLPLVGGTMTGVVGVIAPDDFKWNFGTGSDLEIYHDGSHSYISEQGTGRLIIKSDYFEIDNAAGTEAMLECIEDGAVNLYYDSSKKFETIATGIAVTGDVGIGTASPSYKLDILGTGAPRIRVKETTDDTVTTMVEVENSDGNGAILGVGGSNRSDILDNRGFINAQTGLDGLAIGTEGTDPIIFFTQGLATSDERMRISSDGDVGIGTTASDGNFQVKKAGVNTGITNVLINASFSEAAGSLSGLSIGYRTDETTAVIAPRTATGNLAFYNYDGGWSESMRITNTGHVGIAVDNPEARLQVNEIPQAGGSTTTAPSLAHFVGSTAPSTVNGFATLKLEYPAGATPGDAGAQIMFTQGYHSGDPDNTQPVGSLRGYRTGADTQYGGGLQLTYQPDALPLGLVPGITLDGAGTVTIGTGTVAAANVAADDFVITGPGTTATGMTISNTSDSGVGTIFFGDTTSSAAAGFRYDHNTGDMSVSAEDDINFTCDNATFTGDATIGGKTYPKLNLTDNQGIARTFSVGTNNETFTVRNETASSDAFTIAGNTNQATFAGDVGIGGAYTDQNGVRTFSQGGTMVNNVSYNIDITVDDDSGIGTVHHITAMMTHFSTTYGCVLDCYAYTRATSVDVQTDLLNQSNAEAGGWTVSKPDTTTLRLTKSAGTYTGVGNYQVVVVTRTP